MPQTPPKQNQDPFKNLGQKAEPGAAANQPPASTPFVDEVLKPKEPPRKKPSSREAEKAGGAFEANRTVDLKNEDQAPLPPAQPVVETMPEPGSKISQSTEPVVTSEGSGVGLESLADSTVAAAEKKALLFKILTILVVVLFLAGLGIGGIFAYNKWVKPSLNKNKTASTTPEETKTKTTTPAEDKAATAKADTDQDGLLDEWENKYGLNPQSGADAAADPDLDQLNNRDEYKYGTDPNNPDTDKDGFRDGVEVQKGFNPSGQGKLGDGVANSGSNNDFRELSGKWSGNLTGAALNAKDVELTFGIDGVIIGTYNFIGGNGNEGVFSRAKGNFSYSKTNSRFTANLTVKGFFGQEGIDYELSLMGQAANGNEIGGTWNMKPAREVSWLPADHGTFKLKKGG